MVKLRKNIKIIDETQNIKINSSDQTLELTLGPEIKTISEIMPSTQNKAYVTYKDLINDKENILILDMSKKGLSKLNNNFSDLICKLDDLKELYINNNHLNTLPSELFARTNMTKLDLSDNLLCETSTEYIYKLINLRDLNLSNCGDYSPNMCYLTNLTILNLSNHYFGCHNKKLQKYLSLKSGTDISLGVYGQIGEKLLGLSPKKDIPIPKNITPFSVNIGTLYYLVFSSYLFIKSFACINKYLK